ncbi:MAG TPA: A/G-specific adenine glycosylase [Burkholderiales bacterium]|nr:A/G-specific adenine glycosylase [Burkholderiales bacterium]
MSFAANLIAWQRRHGRHDLPWQGTRDPYRVWLSEIMLQQTQVRAVVPYYERFLRKYPTVATLARASEEDVLRLWSGLGYYARGRNLHKAAQEIHRNGFPRTARAIAELPGVGRSTAAAIAVFAFGERAAILDGNVKRVLSRFSGVSKTQSLWELAERQLPRRGIERYTQALMDLGATVCTRNPDCGRCPLQAPCVARKTGRTAELPAPRRRKALPLKKSTWYVYRSAGKVLLERRASSGIWGGLWCFPDKPVLKSRIGRRLAPIDHGFTHFRLRIQPFLHEVKPCAGGARRWLDIEDALSAAIPTPVKKLLAALQS